jgi:hypothetical protein
MVTGLPGAGIGGLFYLGSALWLPVRGAWRRLRGGALPWEPALRSAGIALGIVAAIWLAGVMIGLWAGPIFQPVAALAGRGPGSVGGTTNLLATLTLALSLGTLALVLLMVQVARVVVRRPASRRSRR